MGGLAQQAPSSGPLEPLAVAWRGCQDLDPDPLPAEQLSHLGARDGLRVSSEPPWQPPEAAFRLHPQRLPPGHTRLGTGRA